MQEIWKQHSKDSELWVGMPLFFALALLRALALPKELMSQARIRIFSDQSEQTEFQNKDIKKVFFSCEA